MIRRASRIIGAISCVLALQLTAACAGTKHLPTPIPRTEIPAPGPALWKVADEDTTIYLFGTVHALPRNVTWYEPHIAKALETADELVTEVDLDNSDALPAMIRAKALLPPGQNLRDLLAPEDRKAFEEVMISLGLPVQAFDSYKPWYAAMTFSLIPLLNSGYDTDNGVESVLASKVRPDTQRDELETVEYQLDLFDSLPEDTQLAYLKQVAASVPKLSGELDAMVKEWLAGDADALAKLLNAQETDPVLYERLLTSRNANWANWIEGRMDQPGTVFIAVGAGHLAGEGSVQDQLKKHGIKSARVH